MNSVTVLAAATPPDSAKPLASFYYGTLQDKNAALSQAEEYKTNHQPTGTIQDSSIPVYNTNVVITT